MDASLIYPLKMAVLAVFVGAGLACGVHLYRSLAEILRAVIDLVFALVAFGVRTLFRAPTRVLILLVILASALPLWLVLEPRLAALALPAHFV